MISGAVRRRGDRGENGAQEVVHSVIEGIDMGNLWISSISFLLLWERDRRFPSRCFLSKDKHIGETNEKKHEDEERHEDDDR